MLNELDSAATPIELWNGNIQTSQYNGNSDAVTFPGQTAMNQILHKVLNFVRAGWFPLLLVQSEVFTVCSHYQQHISKKARYVQLHCCQVIFEVLFKYSLM